MPTDPDEDHTDEMADRLEQLDEHIAEAEGDRDAIAHHADAPGDPMPGSADAGPSSSGEAPGDTGSRAAGEEPEEQANPT